MSTGKRAIRAVLKVAIQCGGVLTKTLSGIYDFQRRRCWNIQFKRDCVLPAFAELAMGSDTAKSWVGPSRVVVTALFLQHFPSTF